MTIREIMQASALVAGLMVIGLGSVVGAVQSQLTQDVNPSECTYTTTQTGNGENTVDTCQNQEVPTVENVVINSGRPVIKGVFQASNALSLRVWINSQWYTYGTDARLTVLGNEWTLDLSGAGSALPPGNYEVVVEIETLDGLLLRHVSAASFYVPVTANIPNSPVTQQPATVMSLLQRLFLVVSNETPAGHDDQDASPPVAGGAAGIVDIDSPTNTSQGGRNTDSGSAIAIIATGFVALGVGAAFIIGKLRLRP